MYLYVTIWDQHTGVIIRKLLLEVVLINLPVHVQWNGNNNSNNYINSNYKIIIASFPGCKRQKLCGSLGTRLI